LWREVPGIGLCIRYIRLLPFAKTRVVRAVWKLGIQAIVYLLRTAFVTEGSIGLLMYLAASHVVLR